MTSDRAGRSEVTWYERERDLGEPTDRWLRAARSELPEAVPQRFGDSEPLQHRFAEEGDEGLRRAWAGASGLLFLSSRPTVDHASLAERARPAHARLGDMAAHALRIALPPEDPRLMAFVLAFTTPATVFATVNETLRQQQIGSGSGSRRYLSGLGQWLGLPEEPPRWCWFGAAYTRALQQPEPQRKPPWWRRSARTPKHPPIQLEAIAGGARWTGGPWVPRSMRLVEAGLEPHDRWADRIPPEVGPPRPVWAGARRLAE